MENKLISVIVPLYNCQSVIKRCLDTIKEQSYKNIEIILVNDGSVDSTLSVIEKEAILDKRIRIISQENQGVSVARNIGIDNAKGEFITFIDADDYVEKTYLEELYNVLEEYNADISFCSTQKEVFKTTINKELISNVKNTNIKINIFSVNEGYSYLKSYANRVEVWGTLYKKSVINETRFDTDLFVGEDALFFANVAKKSKKIIHINKKLYHYITYQNSLYHGNFDEKKYTELEAWNRIIKIFENVPKVIDSVRGVYAICCRGMITKYYSDSIFMEKYYMDIFEKYKEYRKFLLRTKECSFKERIKDICFMISPKLCHEYYKKKLNKIAL